MATTRVDSGIPILHCFEQHGAKLAYFVRTGDLVVLSDAAFDALELVEKGASVSSALEDLGRTGLHHEGTLSDLRAELDVLSQHHYLEPEMELTDKAIANDISALLRHRPRNLMFFVTEACNMACMYCYEKNQGVHDAPKTLKRVDARSIIDKYMLEAAGRKSMSLTFFGGEPLLNFAVIRSSVNYAVMKAKEIQVEVSFTMTTNLTLLTEEMADFLSEHRFHVMVSLDGDKQANDRYRQFKDGSGTYDTVARNIGMLSAKMRARGVRVPRIRATMTAENSNPILVDEHLRALGASLVDVGETHGTAPGGKEAYDVGSKEWSPVKHYQEHIHRVLEQLAKEPEKAPAISSVLVKALQRVHAEVVGKEVHSVSRPDLCGVCRNMKAVTPGGDLYPCHRYVGMEAFNFGNIHSGGMDTERVSGYYRDIYDAYLSKCVKCWARHLCGGQCPWYLSRSDGTIASPDDSTCDQIRGSFERTLGFYAILLARYPKAFSKILGVDAVALSAAHEEAGPCNC